MKLLILTLSLVLAAAIPAGAAEIAVTRAEMAIGPGESRALEFGTVPQQDTTVLLEIVARLHTAKPSGSMFFLRIALNGREVKAAKTRGTSRLVNRPLISPVAAHLPASWYGAAGWRLIYAPDFEAGRKSKFYEGDPYTLVLDVTDLSNPAAENRLVLSNTADRIALRLKPGEGNLVVQHVTVRTRPGKSPMMAAAADTAPMINTGQPAAGPARYRGELLPGGGLAVTVGKRRWEFSSAFSYPNAGLNRLVAAAAPDTAGQPGWTIHAEPAPGGGQVVAEGPDYRLLRSVRFTARKIEVADCLTNAHRDAALGLLVRHEVSLSGLDGPAVRLAGNPDPAVNDYYSPPNPSVHISLPDQGLGMLCEDDVLRNQARLFCGEAPPCAGVRTEMLRLAPGETYTLRWSIYPVAGPDYFDFINLVRQDWGANFTVDGAWTFFHPDAILVTPVEKLRAQFQRLGIRYAAYCGGWVDPRKDRKQIGFGTGVLDDYWADFRGRLRQAAARIHEAAPQVKVLVYYDSQRDTSEGGHERFRDSWLTDFRGNQLSTEWSGAYSLTYSVFATPGNSYGRAMLAAADRYLDEMRVDGLYWDEMECVAYGAPLLTYRQADGHSCLLDPKRYTIDREVGVTTLLGEPHRLAVIDRVRRKGGVLMGNGPACTRALLATGMPRMVEIQHNDYWGYEGNLGTPLGYMGSRADFGNVTRGLGMACLPVGTRYNYPHEISRYLFPFTPIELHHGYLLGQERIITLHDGHYGWPGQPCLVEVRHFDRDGQLTGADFPTLVAGEARTAVRLAAGEAVVLERLPVSLNPLQGQALAKEVHYGPEGLSLKLDAPQGAAIRIDDGRFTLRPDRRYAVQIGQGGPQPIVREKGSLRVNIAPGKDQRIQVRVQ
jgi:hypothetical protein